MKSFEIVLRPDASALAIGGRSAPAHGGDKATARGADGKLLIPASALRGALRIELEKLLAGLDSAAAACSVHRPAGGDDPCSCPVCRLFGQEGLESGALRLSDAVLGDGDGRQAAVVRPRVAVSRRSRTAVDKHLGFVETSDLLETDTTFRARAWLVPEPTQDLEAEAEEHRVNLEAACSALRAIGGGKSSGFGWLECSIEDWKDGNRTADSTAVSYRGSAASGLRLHFEAQAPLHLGQGAAIGYFQSTGDHAAGSTVRGAVAFALLEQGLCRPEDEGFQQLFGAGATVSFGAARLAGDRPSATRFQCRPEKHVFDDLVGEILRRCAADYGVALAVGPGGACPIEDCRPVKVTPADRRSGVSLPKVSVRTRTAVNRRTGTAMDRKLFTHEVLEPVIGEGSGARRPLVLSAEVWGLGDQTLATLGRLNERQVWLGGKRSQGMGACLLRLEAPDRATEAARARQLAQELAGAVRKGWERVAKAGGLGKQRLIGRKETVLALVLTEPWLPEDEVSLGKLRQGPLEPLDPSERKPRLLARFIEIVEQGRFGALEAKRYGATEKVFRGEVTPREAVAAGSVYVYAMSRQVLEANLDRWLANGRTGCGRNRQTGWGRFVVRGPAIDF